MSSINAYMLDKNSPYLGGTCPVCGGALIPGERVVNCPASNTLHHVDCWEFNGNRCATFGCPGSGTVSVVTGAPVIVTGPVDIEILGPGPVLPPPPPPQQVINRLATFAWIAAAIVSIVVILTLLRLFTMWFAPPTEVVHVTRVVVPATPTNVPEGGIDPTKTNTPQSPPTDTPEPPQIDTPEMPPTTPRPASPPQPTVTPRAQTSITSLRLVNGQTDRSVQTLEDGATISLALAGRYLNIEAVVPGGGVESVRFYLDGEIFCANGRCVENSAPYAMAGDLGGDYYDNWDWQELLGRHTIAAAACRREGGDECDPPLIISIVVTR